MHCSADLTEERAAADADGDRVWDQASPESTVTERTSSGSGDTVTAARGAPRDDTSATGKHVEQLLDPDGLADNILTVMVGIAGGIVVGVIGTIVLGTVTGSGWAILFGLIAWLGATAYLVRRRTVQEAVAKSAYATAIVLLLVPVIALSPFVSVDGGIGERGGLFVVLLVFVAVPAGIAAAVGWLASRFIPAEAGSSDG